MLENELDNNRGPGDGSGGADQSAVTTGTSRGGVSSRPAGPPDPAPPAPAIPAVAFQAPQVLFQAPQPTAAPVAPTVAKTLPPACEITLGQAVPKGKNMDLIVEKATEIGAAAIAPLLSERTVVKADADEALSKRDKWQRVAIEACPAGAVLVMDSRGDPRAASAGGILVRRLMMRGAAGIVTDGGFRDSGEIATLEMPAFHQRPSAPPSRTSGCSPARSIRRAR